MYGVLRVEVLHYELGASPPGSIHMNSLIRLSSSLPDSYQTLRAARSDVLPVMSAGYSPDSLAVADAPWNITLLVRLLAVLLTRLRTDQLNQLVAAGRFHRSACKLCHPRWSLTLDSMLLTWKF